MALPPRLFQKKLNSAGATGFWWRTQISVIVEAGRIRVCSIMDDLTVVVHESISTGDQTAALTVGGFVVVLAIFTVVARFYARTLSKAGLGWDDWLILVAVVVTVLTAGLLLWSNAIDPNGAWVSDNTDPDYVYTPHDVLYIKLSFVTSVLYFTISGSTKLGILVMYKRIFNTDATFRYQLALASFLVIAWWVGCTVATLTNCIPLNWTWLNALDDPRYCFNFNVFWLVSGVCEVLIDFIVLALPARVVLSLQLSTQKKAAVVCIFLLGGFVIITGLIRVILGYVPDAREPSYSKTEVWTAIHAGMAIVCASLPVFRPIATRISRSTLATKLTNSISRRHSYSSGGWSVVGKDDKRRSDGAFLEAGKTMSETELRRISVV
ncbi:hypothetical protein MMC25_006121 [Agyrium rufum]|nr:hypothetical protein [Agyrium rufum]